MKIFFISWSCRPTWLESLILFSIRAGWGLFHNLVRTHKPDAEKTRLLEVENSNIFFLLTLSNFRKFWKCIGSCFVIARMMDLLLSLVYEHFEVCIKKHFEFGFTGSYDLEVWNLSDTTTSTNVVYFWLLVIPWFHIVIANYLAGGLL